MTRVILITTKETWKEIKTWKEAKPMVEDGTIKVVIVPAKALQPLIQAFAEEEARRIKKARSLPRKRRKRG